ncbi:ABC-F family ATP-binding cassette domain-containing protein [Falsihalocynthiibacter sp. S25ZX9]|uniref:ABC-F family ATP-binding cassette domain-containing protein n=1 Tax=Falsihalocynthiibacter sp. S25ZX9 TaxID=3240870 RepID=UPI0035104C13
MARIPLLQLTDISLGFGGDPLFSDLSLVVQPADRVALVGRNGSGKSTLMKVMAGLIEPDNGARIVSPGVRVGYMEQDPDLSGFETLGDFASSELDPIESYKVDMVAEGLKFKPETLISAASGGEKRRAALAKLLAEEPQLMLLDEPTNHLDIEAIAWLEDQLRSTRAGFILISHDRAFLNALTRATLWVDRGKVRRLEEGFEAFEGWRDKTWEDEDSQRHKLNRLIKSEAKWAVEGISARRTRNQGRLRALGDLKEQRSGQVKRQGAAAMAFDASPQSGRKVIEAENLTMRYDDKQILSDFSIKIARGDRVAFVGPNGVGKTTLLKILIGDIEADSGTVKRGTKLQTVVFDQNRSQLDPNMTLWDSLTGDPDMRVSGKADQVSVRGVPRHVIGYLKDFLFDETRARAPVSSLSGGEKARLLLAKIMARESNLLVLDEPTNDLDVETLDLLQDLIGEYDGTVLLVSHDRDFLDRVTQTTIAMEGNGNAVAYAGGWSDYRAQRQEEAKAAPVAKSSGSGGSKNASASKSAAKSNALSFVEQHRLEALPKEIARFEAEITKLEEFLAAPDLFTDEPVKFQKGTDALLERHDALAKAEEEWMKLAERAEA